MSDFSDNKTTLKELKDLIYQFATERNWVHYHKPKNLSMALTVEAGELMEHFMWLEHAEVDEMLQSKKREHICDELADIVTYALELANVMEVDLSKAIESKYHKNCLKYPVDECRDTFEKRKSN